MTFEQLQERVMAFGYGEADRNWIKTWLNMAYADVAIRRRWSWLERTATLTTTPGTQTVSVPEPEGALVTYWGRLKPQGAATPPVSFIGEMTDDEGAGPRGHYDLTNPGAPREYSLWGGGVVFYPVPDRAYSYSLRYWTLPAELENTTDVPLIPEGFHNLLVLGALMYAADRDHNPALYQQRQAAYEAQIDRLMATERLRQAESPTKVPMPSHYGGVFDG